QENVESSSPRRGRRPPPRPPSTWRRLRVGPWQRQNLSEPRVAGPAETCRGPELRDVHPTFGEHRIGDVTDQNLADHERRPAERHLAVETNAIVRGTITEIMKR